MIDSHNYSEIVDEINDHKKKVEEERNIIYEEATASY